MRWNGRTSEAEQQAEGDPAGAAGTPAGDQISVPSHDWGEAEGASEDAAALPTN
jgi:hypothetical protein